MANQRGGSVPFSPFDPQVSRDRSLIPSVYAPSQSADAAQAVTQRMADKVGALADQLAQDAGTRAGLAAGTDPNFRPTEGFTIKDRAFDRAATDTYLSNLSARFHSDALDVFDKYKDDPAGLKTAYESLVKTYRSHDVFPEIDGAFVAQATNLGTTLRRSALSGWESKVKDQQQGALIGDIAARETAGQRLLALDPHAPDVETSYLRLKDENVANIRALVASGSISAQQGEKMVLEAGQNAQVQLAMARASTLATSGDVDAYRQQLREKFAAGGLPGLSDWSMLDASLGALANKKRTETDAALRTYQSDLADYLARSQSDGSSVADWAMLEARARTLGPAAMQAAEITRRKLAGGRIVASLAPDQAQTYIDDLKEQSRASASGAASSPGTKADVPTYIAQKAQQLGIDPQIALRVAASEAMNVFDPSKPDKGGDGGSSFGPYQLHYGGLNQAMPHGGLGDEFTKATGLDARDPSTWRQQVDFALTWARSHGWGDWMGAKAQGITGMQGIDPSAPNTGTGTEAVQDGTGASLGAGANAEIIDYLEKRNEQNRRLIATDPLEAAAQSGMVTAITPVDFGAGTDDIATALKQRVAQADAVAGAYRRAPQYIRPDEKPVLLGRIQKGGDEALSTLMGIIKGAGTATPAFLKEISVDAPAMTHAALVAMSTNDVGFARQVAEAEKMRAEGGTLPQPDATTIDQVVATEVGTALGALDPAELARTRAAAVDWATVQIARRGLDAKVSPEVANIVQEAVQRARGQTKSGSDSFGGVGSVGYGGGYFHNTIKVQLPADVKSDRFADVLDAITDEDLAKMSDPPVSPAGTPLKADDLRRNAPFFASGGYLFGMPDEATGSGVLVMAKSGQPFTLAFDQLRPVLRARVPDAFR